MLAAGRDLDALVAEKVMGLQLEGFWDSMNQRPVRPYSTSIAAAWQVLNKLQTLSCYLEVGSAGWTARFADSPATEAPAPTAPLAICLAALKAVGYTESKEDE